MDRTRGTIVWPAVGLGVTSLLALATHVFVARVGGPQQYAAFSVIWGVFFGIGGALAGQQQEVMRLVSGPRVPGPSNRVLLLAMGVGVPFAVAAGVLAAVADLSTASSAVLGLGLLGLCAMTCLNGVLSARGEWRDASAVLALDATVRALVVAVVISAGAGQAWLTLAVASGAFGWVLILVLPSLRRAVTASASTGFAAFARRSGTAMLGSGCAALLLAGFPLLVAVAEPGPLTAGAGVLLATLVLLRSPLLMVTYAYRPALMRSFLAWPGDLDPLRFAWLVCSGVGAIATALAAVVGPWLLRFVLGPGYAVGRLDIALLTASGVLLVMVTVSTLALVAHDRHGQSLLGWLAAVAITLVLLRWYPDPGRRLSVAAGAGPLAALLVHAWVLRRTVPPPGGSVEAEGER